MRNAISPMAVPLGLLVLLVAQTAQAHVGQGDIAGGFATGFQHPISGLDHVVAMLAVGLWGAQLGRPAIWLLPVTFPLVMAMGGVLGALGVPVPAVEVGIASSAIVLGGMVTFAARPPLWIAALLVGLFAVFHGYAHGAELPESVDAMSFSIGFVIATGMLHAVGILIGAINQWAVGTRMLRAGGAAIALCGVWFLSAALGG